MAHQPPEVLFPHEQYGKRAYKAASAVARKRRRSKLNDHRRQSLLYRTMEAVTAEAEAEQRSDVSTLSYSNNDHDEALLDASLPSAIAVDASVLKVC